jgi:L,D-transpeptidase YcbB
MSKITTLVNLSVQPSDNNPNSRNHPATFRIRPFFLIGLFSTILFLNTSFQISRNEMERIESVFLVHDFMNGLKIDLSDTVIHDLAVLDGEEITLYNEVRKYYSLRSFRPAWTIHNRLNENGAKLISLFEHAREYGLEPVHYHIVALREIQDQLIQDKSYSSHAVLREKAEMMLTDAAMKIMVNLHLGYGAFDTMRSSAWIENLPALLLEGNNQNKVIENILAVQPRFIEYVHLQQATCTFVRQTQLTDDWQKITEPGKDSALFINQVKQVLIKLGYINNNCHDTEIGAGLKKFQMHHGFEPDGKAGKNTLEALKMTSLYRYRMLALNLDRLRKQDHSGSNLLYVNIPAYQLKIFRENHLQDIYRVIVGNPKTPTPQLTSRVERIIANPTWDVPESITRNELLPKIKADTGYLKRNHFRLINKQNRKVSYETIDLDKITDEEFGYTLRQESSSDNALGRVKFIFSNPYAVYLHDTPAKTLFSKDVRDLSHGCIRVQNPEKLADYMVRVIQSDSTNICRLIENGTHREFNLSAAIPIHISYITCDTDENGNLFFYNDIYGIDQKELAELVAYIGI